MFRKLNKNKKKNKNFRSSASKQEENPKPVINNVFSEEQTANNNDRINNKDDIDGNASDDDTGTTELLDLIRRENTSKGKKRMRGGDHDNGADGGVVVGNDKNNTNKNNAKDGSVVHSYGLSDPSSERAISGKDMATRSAEHHPLENEKKEVKGKDNGGNDDGGNDKKIYKGMDTKRNKFLAGPLKAPTFVRTTCRFDYQPDICKDYKETGFCGFGDTCIYLHDRGDTKSGWQMEREWEDKKRKEMEARERDMDRFVAASQNEGGTGDTSPDDCDAVGMGDNSLPFACFLCRGPFSDPVVTICSHYFCQKCILAFVREKDQAGDDATSSPNNSPASSCPICSKGMNGLFNYPSKLYAKKKRLLGSGDGTWDEFQREMQKRQGRSDEDE